MNNTSPTKPTTRGKHSTKKPVLSAEDVKFANLLFASRAQIGGGSSVARCYTEAGFPARETEQATIRAAYRRVKNRQFREFYRILQDAAAASAQVTPSIVTRELARIALFDLRQVFDDRGRIRLPCDWSDAVAAGILSVESEEIFEYEYEVDETTGKKVRRKVLVGYTRKVKRCPPTEALKLLAQILRMIGQDAEGAKAAPAPLVIGGEANVDAL